MLALYWTVVNTMFHLTVSIQVIFGIVMHARAVNLKKLMQIGSTAMCLIQLVTIGLIPVFFEPEVRWIYASLVFVGSYIILAITYIVTYNFLKRTLVELQSLGDFESQRKSILTQFFIFCLAMVYKTCVTILLLLLAKFTDLNEFPFSVIQITTYVLVDILPISFILYSHYGTYWKNVPEITSSGPDYMDQRESAVIHELHTFVESDNEEEGEQESSH